MESQLQEMIIRSVKEVIHQHESMNAKMKVGELTSINTSIRYNTQAGIHVHTGAKVTVRLHSSVSERDPMPNGRFDNSKVQI